jgi:folate-binding protein YgfZ
MTGYEALREGAAILDLTGRGVILLTGEDRARFLHAMSSNHVQGLRPGEGCYAFFLNAQGRILADANLLCLDGRFLADTEAAARVSLYQHLDKYIIADDVQLEDATDRYAVLGVEGPKAAEILVAAGAPAPQQSWSHAGWNGTIVAAATFTGGPGFRLFTPDSRREEIAASLLSRGAVPASPHEANVIRIENCRPRYGVDFSDDTLPQETRLAHALHFSKGCYLGQEIVERIRSRGRVHRQIVGLFLNGDPPSAGMELTAGSAAVGRITSAAMSPSYGKAVAIAILREEHAAPGKLVHAGLEEAEVRSLQPC